MKNENVNPWKEVMKYPQKEVTEAFRYLKKKYPTTYSTLPGKKRAVEVLQYLTAPEITKINQKDYSINENGSDNHGRKSEKNRCEERTTETAGRFIKEQDVQIFLPFKLAGCPWQHRSVPHYP